MSGQRFTIRGIDDFERALELIGYASDDSDVNDDSSDSDSEIGVGDDSGTMFQFPSVNLRLFMYANYVLIS